MSSHPHRRDILPPGPPSNLRALRQKFPARACTRHVQATPAMLVVNVFQPWVKPCLDETLAASRSFPRSSRRSPRVARLFVVSVEALLQERSRTAGYLAAPALAILNFQEPPCHGGLQELDASLAPARVLACCPFRRGSSAAPTPSRLLRRRKRSSG